MPQIDVKLVNFETGEERTLKSGSKGLWMAVTTKVPTINNQNCALCMAYIASHPDALKMKGTELIENTTEFFLEWDYIEAPDENEGDSEGEPIDPNDEEEATESVPLGDTSHDQ